MKKLALAIALIATSAAASAQLTVYGVADVGVQRDFSGKTSMESGLQSESRLGFRGKEDLGNGTSAIFGLEAGFSLDNGSQANGSLFNRQSYVGLQGPLGTVKLGRQMTPVYEALYSVDPFQAGLAGNATRLMNDGGQFSSNSITYANKLGPVSGQFLYGMGNETAGNHRDGRVLGASVGAAFGPVNTVAAYHSVNVVGGRDRTVLLGATAAVTSGLKVHGAVADNKGTSDSRDYMLGVSAKATSVDTFLGSVIRKQDRTVAGNDATQYALGWTHSLSQRTNLYTSYGQTKYDAQATDKIVNVGIRHRF